MKKFLSWLLTLTLIFGMMPMSAFAADELPKVSLLVSKEQIAPGEDVELSLVLDKDVEGMVNIWQWNFVWDSTCFDVKEAKIGDAAQSVMPGVAGFEVVPKINYTNPTTSYVSPYATATVTSGDATIPHYLKAGTIAIITLTAKENEEVDNSKFYIDGITVADGSGNALNVLITDAQYEWGDNTQTLPAEDKGYNVSVKVPQVEDETAGYTVTMPADKEVIVGEQIDIAPVIGYNGDVKAYNAFDMTFSYDEDILELVTTEIEGIHVTEKDGKVIVQGYGDERLVETAPFTLSFKAIETGDTAITVDAAKVDIAENAIDADAPEAVILDDVTAVKVSGYPVALPENFGGESVANPGEDYIFELPEDYYDYTVTVTVDGEEVEAVYDEEKGTYTIAGQDVTGSINVTMTREGKKFNVTLGEDMKGSAEKAQYMVDYVVTLSPVEGFNYEVAVTIDGKEYTGYEVSGNVSAAIEEPASSDITYTIPGEDIIGDVVFTVTKTEIPDVPVDTYSVTFEGNAAGNVQYESLTVEKGQNYSFSVEKQAGYEYTVSAVMAGEAVECTEKDGMYTISNVTGDLVITVNKVSTAKVNVDQFVQLDGKTVFLVTVNETLEEGKAYMYAGTAMFYSEKYNAWSYLVIVDKDTTFTAEDANEKLTISETSYTTLAADSTNVNMSKNTDINDAQLVYDIYNGEYDDFSAVTMQKFLNADVNNDKTVNVTDAAAVIAAINK